MEKNSDVIRLTLCAHYLSVIGEDEEGRTTIFEDFGGDFSTVVKDCEDQRIPTVFSLKLNMLEKHEHYIDYVLRTVFRAEFSEEESSSTDKCYTFNSKRTMFQALSRIADVIF